MYRVQNPMRLVSQIHQVVLRICLSIDLRKEIERREIVEFCFEISKNRDERFETLIEVTDGQVKT